MPGVQAWYNQFLQVDPTDPNHVYAGLEEVYETKDGGATWTTVGPYWNFAFPCWSIDPTKQTGDCSPTTHSDQHARRDRQLPRQELRRTSATTAASTSAR